MRVIVHLRSGERIRLDNVVGAEQVLRRWRNIFVRRLDIVTVNKHQLNVRKLAVLGVEVVDTHTNAESYRE